MWITTLFSGIVVATLLMKISNVNAITPYNPCDPMKSKVKIKFVLKTKMIKIAKKLKFIPVWFKKRMKYVNCSRRGLNKIPSTIPTNVQILDLSLNKISHVRKKDLEKFTDLQVLWLRSNCKRDSSHDHANCKSSGLFDKSSLSSLTSLKMLNIAANFLKRVPSSLPISLEYLDISKNKINKIEENDLSFLTNLTILDATNLCSSVDCKDQKYSLHIDNHTFEKLSLKLFSLSQNHNVFHLMNYLDSKSFLYLNFGQTYGRKLYRMQLNNLPSLKRLELFLQNPNTKVKLQILNNTFDQLLDLEFLDLSSNMIEFLPTDVFQHNQKLIHLDLSGNCLFASAINPEYVPDQIKYLYLGYNYCYTFNGKNFQKNQTVLSSRGFNAFGSTFLKMKNLTVLSYRKPHKVGTALQESLQIEFFDISNRTLFNLLQLKRLSKLVITDSYIQKVDLTTINSLSNLVLLDISNNVIENINVSKASLKAQNNCLNEVKLLFSYNKIKGNLGKTNLIHPKATWLNLQFNLISSIRGEAFKNMPCLIRIDLRNNPILFVYPNAFKNLLHLSVLYISSLSIFRNDRSLQFLHNTRLNSTSQSLYLSLLSDNLFRNLRRNIHRITASTITIINLSKNQITSADHIQTGLKMFPNATVLTLKRCGITFSNFYLPTPFVTNLDLTQNQIRKIMPKFIKSVPLLTSLILSHNKITQIEFDLFHSLSNLEYLDFSHNHISVVSSNKTSSKHLKKLKVLKFQDNYIFKLSEDVFSLFFLGQLHHLDLRWNSIECHCEMTKSFGRWLSQGSYSLNERPGLLPRCFSGHQFGECVTCAAAMQNDNVKEQSFVQFVTTNLCSSSFGRLLAIYFTSFFILFTSISSFLSSSKGMLWLAKFSTRRVRAIKDENDEQNFPAIFAFHGYILFDTADINTGNWVDDQLVPELNKISPDIKIAVTGRDDQCGFTPVTQQLFKIEASRKVIVVLTGNYWQSSQGKYVLSAIEDLHYQTGHDRAVIVTFENELHVGGLLRRRKKNSPWSVLKYPADERDKAMFWESLHNSLL